MKKNMILALFALVALVAADASAYGYRRGYRGNCGSCEVKSCAPCAVEAPKVCKTVEEPMQDCPRCYKWVPVEAPCNVTRHIYYSCECPEGYTSDSIAK